MKKLELKGLSACPICGAKSELKKNASKDFEISCSKCAFRTGWTTKPEAITRWYNMSIQYWKTMGMLKTNTEKEEG